jgi:hypothetical protein
MRRWLILGAMTLSALASELGAAGHRCAWNGMPRTMRARKGNEAAVQTENSKRPD